MPRASRVEVVSATSAVPFDCSKKSVGNGRLCALACCISPGGKRIPKEGDEAPAMCPLASVYMWVAERFAFGQSFPLSFDFSNSVIMFRISEVFLRAILLLRSNSFTKSKSKLG